MCGISGGGAKYFCNSLPLWRNTEGTCTHRLFCSHFQNTRPCLYAPLKKGIFQSQSFPFTGKICLHFIMNTSFWWRWIFPCTLHGTVCARQFVPHVSVPMVNIICTCKLTYCLLYKHALIVIYVKYYVRGTLYYFRNITKMFYF